MATKSTPIKPDDSPFRTSPSVIARYFFQDCERFLRYSASSTAQRKRDALPLKEFDHSPLMKAIFESGYDWERAVLETHLKGKAKVAAGSGEIHTRRFDWSATTDLLRTAKPGTYIYQPTLRTPRAFYDRFGLDSSVVTFSDNHPDLIAVLPGGPKGRLLRVMDVKRGESLKLTHRVQVLLYAMQLVDILAEEGVTDATADLANGSVWLGGQSEPKLFDLGDFQPHLESFLRNDLMRILKTEIKEVPWHLYFRCEWCEYFEHCQSEMRTQNDVSRLTHLTTYGKQHLREAAGVRTVPQLEKFLQRKDADETLSKCASLAGSRPFLTKQVSAIQKGTPELHGAASPSLPKGENIGLFLTLQQEPLGQQVYLAGVHLRGRPELFEKLFSKSLLAKFQTADGKLQPWITIASEPNQCGKVQEDWIRLVHQILVQVDRYNRNQSEWREQVSLQWMTVASRFV